MQGWCKCSAGFEAAVAVQGVCEIRSLAPWCGGRGGVPSSLFRALSRLGALDALGSLGSLQCELAGARQFGAPSQLGTPTGLGPRTTWSAPLSGGQRGEGALCGGPRGPHGPATRPCRPKLTPPLETHWVRVPGAPRRGCPGRVLRASTKAKGSRTRDCGSGAAWWRRRRGPVA